MWPYSVASLVLYAAIIILAVILVRFLWVFPATYVPRWASRSAENGHGPKLLDVPARGLRLVGTLREVTGLITGLGAYLALPLVLPELALMLLSSATARASSSAVGAHGVSVRKVSREINSSMRPSR